MRTRLIQRQPNSIANINNFIEMGYDSQLALALDYRGINSNDINQYLEGTTFFYDPFAMPNMDRAVECLRQIIECGGSVLIYGDYDADGLSASCLLSLYLSSQGVDNDIVVPTRDIGYGVNVELVRKQFQDKWYDAVVTVDCGISNREEIEQLQQIFGDSVEIIVTDHHELPEQLPDCICLNPKTGYMFEYLSGSGVAYKLVEALSNGECRQYLDLALIGTIADIMPLTDENRSIVSCGLAHFSHKGLIKLAELSSVKPPYTVADISIRIAPKINAAGRIGDLSDAINVMLSYDKADVTSAKKLMEYNDLRRIVNDDIVAQAILQCDGKTISREKLCFVMQDAWHAGVLGIVASKLKEIYNVCAVVMCREQDYYKGSARGIDGIDLFDVFSNCKQFLHKFGGHKASVGFSVHVSQVDNLRQSLIEVLASKKTNCSYLTYYDIAIDGSIPLLDLYNFEQKLQPMHISDSFVYYFKDHVQYARTFGKNNNHISLTLSCGIEAKAFGKYAQLVPALNSGAELELLCQLVKDGYSGNICANILDMSINNSLHFDMLYSCNFVNNINTHLTSVTYVELERLKAIINQPYTIVIADSYQQCELASRLLDLEEYNIDFFDQIVPTTNSIVISPIRHSITDSYKNIVVLCSNEYVFCDYNCNNAVFYPITCDSVYNQLYIDRELCVKVYKAVLAKSNFDSVDDVYTKYLTGRMNKAQYLLCLRILNQLNVIQVHDQYNIKVDKETKVNLADSTLFNAFAKQL